MSIFYALGSVFGGSSAPHHCADVGLREIRDYTKLAMPGVFVAQQIDLSKRLVDQIYHIPATKRVHPTNCKNCGAPLKSSECGYCSTMYL